MQEDHISTYCNTNIKKAFKIIPQPYWTSTVYSLGKYLSQYGYYPTWLPLCACIEHGVVCHAKKPFKNELESDAPTQLVHSPISKTEWEKYSSKPCFIMFSPFVFHRIKTNASQKQNANGTIAFPAHSTPAIDDISDVEEYVKQLVKMPEEFQPVSVCLHVNDIIKGRHHIFEKFNLPVFTAGNASDDRFAERFYDIIKNFKYATSNMVGSYIYYCVEMGIPFSIYGNPQVFINNNDPNIPFGLYDPYKLSPGHRQVQDMFSGLNTQITPEQKEYVETSLGLKDGLSRGKMAWVLYSSFFKWVFSVRSIKHIISVFRKLREERKINS